MSVDAGIRASGAARARWPTLHAATRSACSARPITRFRNPDQREVDEWSEEESGDEEDLEDEDFVRFLQCGV